MKITITREQWRELYDYYLRRRKKAERDYKDEKAYIDDAQKNEPKRWTDDFEHRHWHYSRMNSAQKIENECKQMLKILEDAEEWS